MTVAVANHPAVSMETEDVELLNVIHSRGDTSADLTLGNPLHPHAFMMSILDVTPGHLGQPIQLVHEGGFLIRFQLVYRKPRVPRDMVKTKDGVSLNERVRGALIGRSLDTSRLIWRALTDPNWSLRHDAAAC